MEKRLAIAQALKYAEELRQLHAREREQRRQVEQALARLEDSYTATVRALAAALELRDDETGGHAERVTALAVRLTEVVAPELTTDPALRCGFLLHDLGKIGIPDRILLKPGPLDERETETMRYHTTLGEQLVGRIPYLAGLALQIVASHHERWDGLGYPRRLQGEDIPLAARIFSVVDSWDAMTNDRPYRRALTLASALEEIERGSGSQFDPRVAAAFLALVPELPVAA